MKKLVILFLFSGLLAACASDPSAPTEQDARQIAVDAYIYGYPLVTMEMTRRVMTNVSGLQGTQAPMGHLALARKYPSAEFRNVTAPNADTLYTTAWIDVAKEPWVLSLPEADDRYYLFPMLDSWTNVFQTPGKRTTGTAPQTYAITGPGWQGTLPAGVVEYKSPTSLVWILGRIYCTGTPEDYAAVHRMQDDVVLVPLSAFGKSYTPQMGVVDPNIDMTTPVRDQVNSLGVAAYFDLLAKLMQDNPPAAADTPILKKLALIGIVPGQPFDFDGLEPQIQAALKDVPKVGVDKIMTSFNSANTVENGWVFTTKTGVYGSDYLQRAMITVTGLGANLPQDAVYPTSDVDLEGKPYDAAHSYVMHFNKDQLPPVDGFWSLTMYNTEYFFVKNPLNRYSLSARNDLKKNVDGSVDLYLQKENPGSEKESNWLPAPDPALDSALKDGKFILMLRLYWPKETPPSIIDGTWKIPAVKKVE